MSLNQSTRQAIKQAYDKAPGASNSILTELKGNQLWIYFNRPKRFNAFTIDMYTKLALAIRSGNTNDQAKFIILTGNGGNFSSGNDLQNFTTSMNTGADGNQISAYTIEILTELNQTIINSKKPIFAITEGKVIGFAFTILGLFDRVFAVEGSEFTAPLVKLAQGPEMCSSYTFIKIFGKKVAEDILVKGIKVDAAFLEKYNLATACKSRVDAEKQLQQHLRQLDALEWNSLVETRKLFGDNERQLLLDINRREMENLHRRWTHPNFLTYIMDYMSKMKTKPKL